MGHRQILLYGFHFSFLFIFFLATLRDIGFGNFFNATINLSAFLFTALSYYLLHFRSKIELTTYMIMAIAIIPLYILIYFNHFGNMVIVYVLLIPLAVFLLLPFRQALIFNFFVYLLLIGMLYYISIINPDAPILNNTLALINIAFVSILIMFFGVFYHLAIESTLSELIRSDRQKGILLKEVHHRVKNNLNVTAAMLGLQAMQEPTPIKSHILKSKSRIEAIATVHEMLYQQESFEEILIHDYIIRLETLLAKAYHSQERYHLDIDVDKKLALPLNTMVQFGLMLNEMLTNTIKYATNPHGLTIHISLKKEPDSYLFSYKDNGIEVISTEILLQDKGLGMKLIELSAKQINGKLMLYYDNGLAYTVRMQHV